MIELLFVISLLGNGWQYLENQDKAETIQTIKKVNSDNAHIVSDISANLKECSTKLANWNSKESNWESQRKLDQQRIKELSDTVAISNWDGCRSPVDLEL
jgi:iron uptake system EfeUOB component EfeO/EfeM